MARKLRLYVSKSLRGRLTTERHKNWRKTLMKMQRGKCYYCGCDMDEPTLDHVIPLSKGGEDTFENVVAACEPCNREKADSV